MNKTKDLKLSANTLKRLGRKKTVQGRIREMNTLHYFRESHPTDDFVLKRIFEARRIRASNKCARCEKEIDRYYKKVPGKPAYRCKNCSYRVYPLVGTPFEQSRISLRLTLELVYRMIQSKHGFTTAEVMRDYGLSEEAAWTLLHRNRRWMGICVEQFKFAPDAYIEIDEVYPLKPTGLGKKIKLSRGLGSERIAKVITMVERCGRAKGFVVDNANGATVRMLLEQHAKPTMKIRTDESRIYLGLKKKWNHARCNHRKKQWAQDDAHTNTCEALHSFIQGNISHVHKGVKYLQQYIDETVFRFAVRFETPTDAINHLMEALPPLFETTIDTKLQEVIKNKIVRKAS